LTRYASVDAYIASFPADIQPKLQSVRQAMRSAAPGTQETISYDIPTFTLAGKYVVYFAGWKHHISVYPIPEVDESLEEEIRPYLSGKGTLKFPLDEPLPLDLIGRVTAALLKRRTEQRG
jgi:uncharacterized protein YdhG (YjbR/CyaY superfamily)